MKIPCFLKKRWWLRQLLIRRFRRLRRPRFEKISPSIVKVVMRPAGRKACVILVNGLSQGAVEALYRQGKLAT